MFKKHSCALMAATCILFLFIAGCGDDGGKASYNTSIKRGGTIIDLSDAHFIYLDSQSADPEAPLATYDDEEVPVYDYTWKVDLSVAHTDVENSPAEYFEGTEPSKNDDVYIAHDIKYLPDSLEDSFTGTAKQGDNTEIACYYDDEVIADNITDLLNDDDYSLESATNFIFAALPNESCKSTMLHSEEEAFDNPVLHINNPGTYVISGTWDGQIWIDGNNDEEDENNVVKIVLDGADINCSVAPALVFHNVYDYEPEVDIHNVNINKAGAKLYIADDSTNNITGANLYRMLKVLPKYGKKDEEPTTVIDGTDVNQQKKNWKMDGAVYSFVSLLCDGAAFHGTVVKCNGVLNIESTASEGLDSEEHMVINGGIVNIKAVDDGINVNDDDSVFALNYGTLNVKSSSADGINSHNLLVINGGSGDIESGGGDNYGLNATNGVYIFGGSVNADSANNLKENKGSGKIGKN